jgi:hypothetical protein
MELTLDLAAETARVVVRLGGIALAFYGNVAVRARPCVVRGCELSPRLFGLRSLSLGFGYSSDAAKPVIRSPPGCGSSASSEPHAPE